MENKTKPAAPSDEDLGAALRKIAVTLGQDEDGFAYYARRFVEWAGNESMMRRLADRRIHRVKVFVQPADAHLDGILEHLVEMMTQRAEAVSPFGHARGVDGG